MCKRNSLFMVSNTATRFTLFKAAKHCVSNLCVRMRGYSSANSIQIRSDQIRSNRPQISLIYWRFSLICIVSEGLQGTREIIPVSLCVKASVRHLLRYLNICVFSDGVTVLNEQPNNMKINSLFNDDEKRFCLHGN